MVLRSIAKVAAVVEVEMQENSWARQSHEIEMQDNIWGPSVAVCQKRLNSELMLLSMSLRLHHWHIYGQIMVMLRWQKFPVSNLWMLITPVVLALSWASLAPAALGYQNTQMRLWNGCRLRGGCNAIGGLRERPIGEWAGNR